MSFRGYLSITFYIIVVLILLVSFRFTKSEIPKQERSRFTGYLTWHGKLHRWYFYGINEMFLFIYLFR